jgi:VWFA-related protein
MSCRAARAVSSGVLIASVAAAGLLAQQVAPRQPVFRAGVELVQVDVVVVDRDGQPVRGLTAADFSVLDRKTPQAIATFSEETYEHPAASSTAVVPITLKRDVASNQDARWDRIVVMVVDDLHIYKGDTARAKDLARQTITDLGPQASMGLLFTSGEHSTQVTQDRSELLAAVETLTGRRAIPRPAQAVDQQVPGHIDPEDSIDTVLDTLTHFSRDVSLQDFVDNMTQYKTLQDAARMLAAAAARRKAFVLLSEGISKDLTGMFDGSLSPCETSGALRCYHDIALGQMMRSLQRSNVATYAIDPRGLVSPQDLLRQSRGTMGGLLSSQMRKDEDSPFDWDNPVRQAQHGLEMLAAASGGFAVTNTDDFAGGVTRIIADLDHFYLLGFYPTDRSGKGYRPLNVTVPSHPEWTLRFRKGYVAGDPPAPAKNTDPLVALSADVMPKTDLPLRLTAVPLPSAGKDARVVVALEATLSRRDLQDTSGRLRADVRYSVLAANVTSGKVVKQFSNIAQVTAGQASDATVGDTVAMQVPVELTLAPGRYQLRASATSVAIGKGGSVYLTLDVPDFTAAPLTISGLVLGYADGAHVPIGRSSEPISTLAGARAAAAAPASAITLPFDLTLDRDFTSIDTLRLYFELARSRPLTIVQVTAELVDASETVRMVVDRQVPANDPGRVDLRLPLTDVESGPYRLRVTATAGTQSARREIGVVVH